MRKLGSGAFAEVYGRDNWRRVIKIGHKWDSYLKYVQLIGLLNPNPYFPQIYHVHMYVHEGDHYYMIEMEKLLRWKSIPTRFRDQALEKLGCESLWQADRPRLAEDSGRHEEELARVLRKLYYKNQGGSDVHFNNVMWRKKGRGYEMVYTDPVA